MLEAGCRVEQLPVTISPVTLTLVFLQIAAVGWEWRSVTGAACGGEGNCTVQTVQVEWSVGGYWLLLAADSLLTHSLREVCGFWHSGVQE